MPCTHSKKSSLKFLALSVVVKLSSVEQIENLILLTASATQPDDDSSNTALYATIAVLAVVVVVILAVATTFVCVFKRRLDTLKEQQAQYMAPTCCGANGRNNAAYQDIYNDAI